MTAFNVVRFHVKPGHEEEFIEAHRRMGPEPPKGARRFSLIRTGDRSFCAIGEWDSFENIVEARPMMIGMLDTFRNILEDMGGDLGVTDPVSGEVVFEMMAPVRRARASRGNRRMSGGARKAGAAVKRVGMKGARAGAKRKAAKKPAKKAVKRRSSRR